MSETVIIISIQIIVAPMPSVSKLTDYLTRKQIEQVHGAFKIFDQDGSGSISIREFDQILKSLGQNLREEQLNTIVQKIDRDGNGFIDFEEFLYLVAPKIIQNRSERTFVEAFRMIDVNGKGYICEADLRKANLVTGAGLTQKQLQQIMEYVGDKFQGKFDLNCVLKILHRMPQEVPEDE